MKSEVRSDNNPPVPAAGPLGGDAVRVLAVVVVAAARAFVGAALLSHHVQTLQTIVIII